MKKVEGSDDPPNLVDSVGRIQDGLRIRDHTERSHKLVGSGSNSIGGST